MPRHRLFLKSPIAAGRRVDVEGERAHYVNRVLRLKKGDELIVFCGDGREYPGRVVESRKTRVVVLTGDAVTRDSESSLAIRLVQGVSRGERMDFAVQKSTELGVSEIVPVQTAFSVVKLSGDRAERRMLHWQKVAQSACEQCGRNRVPAVAAPVPLSRYLGADSDAELRLAFTPGVGGTLDDVRDTPRSIDVLIGPEGGLSDQEIGDVTTAGFMPVSLGRRVLRSETAALAALAVLQSRWGDL